MDPDLVVAESPKRACSTWFYSCKIGDDQKAFTRFQRDDISLVTFLLLSILSSVGGTFYPVALLNHDNNLLNTFCMITGLFFMVMLAWVLLFLHYINRKRPQNANKCLRLNYVLVFLECLFVIGFSSSFILSIISLITAAPCPPQTSNKMLACLANHVHQMPEALMCLVMMFPTMISKIVKSVRSEAVFFAWTLNFITLLTVIYVFNVTLSSPAFLSVSMVTFLNMCEYQRQKISMFFLSQELRGTLTENERLEKENRASELKHLIGNVAHDLKTPLSSLNMGIDLITAVLEETSTLLSSAPDTIKNALLDQVYIIEENLQNMRNVNSFMLMNINRCMDYTKATNGLKLVPHIETAPLIETIALPLHVMNAMQGEKTRIELLPVPKEICSHIITDKQWLEENILCLLSNAVKYSNKGLVTVAISLVDYPPAGELRGKLMDSIRKLSPRWLAANKAKPAPVNKADPFAAVASISAAVPRSGPASTVSASMLRSVSTESAPSRELLRAAEPERFPSPLKITKSNGMTGALLYPDVSPTKSPTHFLRVEVEDTGIGLSDEVMENLFSPFKQAQRLAGGTGLGLFSLSRRVEAIGGRYGVMKRRDGLQGSVFWFEIPYKPDHEFMQNMIGLSEGEQSLLSNNPIARRMSRGRTPTLQKSLESAAASAASAQSPFTPLSVAVSMHTVQSASTSTGTKSLNILLADDTLSIQKMTRMLLQKQGHTVTIAENGVEALELITAKYADRQRDGVTQMFDAVLMDFQMPIMDGLEATRRIRALEVQLREDHFNWDPNKTFHQLIIGLSANSDDETVQLARSEGMDDFMEKPFKAAVFNGVFEKHTRKGH